MHRGILKGAVKFLYPDVCPVCSDVMTDQSGICTTCREKLKYIHNPRCLKCGKQMSDREREYCYDCMTHRHSYTQGIAVWGYTDGIKQSIYRFKYQNCRCFADIYAQEIESQYAENIKRWGAQAILPVPLHAKRLADRGFNQAKLVADALGKRLGIPSDDTVLIRDRSTVPQKELDDKQRFKNLENAFIITENVVRYKKVIILDDIYTTGATMDACAKALHEGGVHEVYSVVLCIGRGF